MTRRRNPFRPPRVPAPKPAWWEKQPPKKDPEPNRLHVTEAERRDRKSYGQLSGKLKPAYAHLLDLGAKGRGIDHARMMVSQIQRLIDRRGWTDSEYHMLLAARQKWERRVAGKDARYLFVGSRVGGLTPHQQRQIDEYQAVIDLRDGVEAVLEDYQAGRIPRNTASLSSAQEPPAHE